MKKTKASWTGLGPYLIVLAAGCSSAPPPENERNSGDNQESDETQEPPVEPPIEPPANEGTGGSVSGTGYDPCAPCDVTPSISITSGDEVVQLPYLHDGTRCIQSPTLKVIRCGGGRNGILIAEEHPISPTGDEQSPPSAYLDIRFHSDSESSILTSEGTYSTAQGIHWALTLTDEVPSSLLEESEATNREATLNYLGTNSAGESRSFIVTLAVCFRVELCTI